MTDYVFDASASTDERNWDDPSSWYGGVVPDAPDADVSFPTVTETDGGDIYTSFVTIQSGESYAIDSVTITNNYLSLIGDLAVGGTLDIETGAEIDLLGGTLTFGSLINAAPTSRATVGSRPRAPWTTPARSSAAAAPPASSSTPRPSATPAPSWPAPPTSRRPPLPPPR